MSARTEPRSSPSLGFRRLRALTILMLAVALVNIVVHLLDGPDAAAPAVAPAAAPGAAPAQAPAAAPADPAAGVSPSEPAPSKPASAAVISDAVAGWHDAGSGKLAVVVQDLSTGRTNRYGDTDHAFATASIVKVDILAALLLQEEGRLSAWQKEVASAMIRQSSNDAATTLWTAIGREKGLAAANKTFGLKQTTGGTRGRWGVTTTTVADQLRLLQVVFTDDSPLTPDARAYMRSLMGGVATDQDWGVTAADSRGDTHAFVKNGWLPRTGGWVVTSVGKVEHEGHPLLVAALSDGGATQQKGVSVVERVARNAAKDVAGT